MCSYSCDSAFPRLVFSLQSMPASISLLLMSQPPRCPSSLLYLLYYSLPKLSYCLRMCLSITQLPTMLHLTAVRALGLLALTRHDHGALGTQREKHAPCITVICNHRAHLALRYTPLTGEPTVVLPWHERHQSNSFGKYLAIKFV